MMKNEKGRIITALINASLAFVIFLLCVAIVCLIYFVASILGGIIGIPSIILFLLAALFIILFANFYSSEEE